MWLNWTLFLVGGGLLYFGAEWLVRGAAGLALAQDQRAREHADREQEPEAGGEGEGGDGDEGGDAEAAGDGREDPAVDLVGEEGCEQPAAEQSGGEQPPGELAPAAGRGRWPAGIGRYCPIW